MLNRPWQIIAGEYPPQHGGVSDYTQSIVSGLADAGHCSHVWTRGNSETTEMPSKGISVHRCAGNFGPADIRHLGRRLNAVTDRLLLVQYVPHAFGYKAMNLPFAWWVRQRATRHHDDVRIMFHEVAYPWVRTPLRHNLLAAVNELMVKLMVGHASRIYVSTTAWNPRLIRLGVNPDKLVSLPIPSNIPEATDLRTVDLIRSRIATASPSRSIVGHFGTYGENVTRLLMPIVEQLISSKVPIHLLFIGGGGERFREQLVQRFQEWNAHISATGRIDAMDVAHHIRASDIMIQPFADGANTRRTSLMACLINRRATVSTTGHHCEAFWSDEKAVRLIELRNTKSAVYEICELIREPRIAVELGKRGYEYYSEHLSLKRTVTSLTT